MHLEIFACKSTSVEDHAGVFSTYKQKKYVEAQNLHAVVL